MTVPRRHIVRKKIKTYRVVYKRKGKSKGTQKSPYLTVTTFQRPTQRTKTFGGKKYRIISIHTKQETVILMAKAAKKKKNEDVEAETDDEEILDAELDELEDLDDADLEDDDEVADDDDDEEVEEKPKGKGKQKSSGGSKKKGSDADGSSTKAKPSRSRTTDGKVGTSEIAAAAGVDARTLRMVLRKHKIEKDDETGRYEWDSLKDKTVQKILKLLEQGEAQAVKKEGLERLKEQQAEKKAKKKKDKEKGKKKNKKKDEDDE